MMLTDEISWNLFDFIMMGCLLTILGAGIDFVIKYIKDFKNRTLYIGILVLIFLLIWAELSVGILDTPIAGK